MKPGCLILLMLTLLQTVDAQTRKVIDISGRYELTTHYFQNGVQKSVTVAVCELSPVKNSAGVTFQRVQWLSQVITRGKDTVNQTADARRVKVYDISLDPKGTLLIPAVEVAAMTGAITDLNTFFVALLAKSGFDSLMKPGDRFIAPSPLKGNFSNGTTILKGEDCIQLVNEMVSLDGSKKKLKTSFLPPGSHCLEYFLPDLQTPVKADTLNNIQMIMPAGPDKYNIQYGREQFIITTLLDTKAGRFIQADMKNDLELKLKINCDDKYSNCQTEMPWHVYREIKLRKL